MESRIGNGYSERKYRMRKQRRQKEFFFKLKLIKGITLEIASPVPALACYIVIFRDDINVWYLWITRDRDVTEIPIILMQNNYIFVAQMHTAWQVWI